MLLEFKSENFKSLVEEVNFSMLAAPKQKGLDYSLFILPKNVNNIKCLCSSVIYGPNAAGKTNIFGAMDLFMQLYLEVIFITVLLILPQMLLLHHWN